MPFSCGSFSSGKRLAELLEKLALFARELARNLHVHVHEQVAPAAALQARHAEILQPDARPGLNAIGNFDRLQAIEGEQVDFGPQRGLRHVDRNGAVQIVALALENRMLFHLDHDVQIAGRPAIEAGLPFVGQLQMRAGVHARRNGDFQLAFGANLALAAALRAGRRTIWPRPPHWPQVRRICRKLC